MFTVEMELDEIAITILDDQGHYEDVGIYIYEDIAYIRQWNEEFNRMTTIAMSADMFEELRASFDQPEGTYIRR